MNDKICNERHGNCEKRMDSHNDSIKTIFSTRVTWKTFVWTLGVILFLVGLNFNYTKSVAADVNDIVRKSDIKEMTSDIVKAIKEAQ